MSFIKIKVSSASCEGCYFHVTDTCNHKLYRNAINTGSKEIFRKIGCTINEADNYIFKFSVTNILKKL